MKESDPLTSAVWRKSSRSKDAECVEVARAATVIGMRDSKDVNGPVLRLAPAVFHAFLDDIKGGRFDR